MFYKKLNFPPIPEHIINSLESSLIDNTVVGDIGYKEKHIKNNKELVACGYSMGNIVNSELTTWLEQNIPDINTRFNILYQTQRSNNNVPSTHIVHTDRLRLTALNYIIDTGGDNVMTSWYKEDGKELQRSKKITGSQSDSGAVDYKNLQLLESVNLEKNNWYIINTRILHDVDNITATRKSISISFSHRKFLE
jgi:hypothetical protein